MVSAEDNPGIFYFLVGVIVLVLAGVGLSVVVDGKIKSSHSGGEIEKEIKLEGEQLASLRAYYDERSHLLADQGPGMFSKSAAHSELQGRLAALKQRRKDLEIARNQLSESIPSLESEFSSYRENYRRRVRSNATGEKLGLLKIRGGREYHNAVLTLVTDVGIEIRHQDGIARVQAPDLDSAWQERFQWSDEERRASLNEEAKNHQKITQDPEEVKKVPVVPVRQVRNRAEPVTTEQQEQVAHLRSQLVGWRAKVSRLSAQKSEAASQASYNARASVPGSLETWQAKSVRLGGELAKARAEMTVAKALLSQASPNDMLLREPVADNEE